MRIIKLALVAALAAAPALTFAQTTAQEQQKNSIVKPEFKREFNQQQRRIGNGISNDRITPRQAARLEAPANNVFIASSAPYARVTTAA